MAQFTLALKFNNFILWMFDSIPKKKNKKKHATLEQKTDNCNSPQKNLKTYLLSMMSVTLSQTNITNMAMKKSWPFEDVQCTYSLVNMGIFHCHVSLPECKQKFTKRSMKQRWFWTLSTWCGRSSEGGRRVTVLTKVGPSSTQRSCRCRKKISQNQGRLVWG